MSSTSAEATPNVIFCLSNDTYSPNFLVSWSELISYCMSNGIKFAISHNYDKNPYFAKNGCLGGNPRGGKKQSPFGGNVSYERMIWLDNDVLFSVQDFEKLIKSDKEVIGGLYMSPNNRNFMSCREMDSDKLQNEGTFEFIVPDEIEKDYSQNKEMAPIRVEFTGMGFLAIKRGVLERLDYPWFFPTPLEFSECGDFYPDDISLFKKLKKEDIPVWVDPTIILGYEKRVNIMPHKLMNIIEKQKKGGEENKE